MSSIDSFSHLFPYINSKFRKCELILTLFGLYFVSKVSSKLIYKLLRLGYVHIWSQIKGNHLNQLNGWALITFVGDPTGLSFAKLLAQKGFNLIIIDENEDILKLISNEILSEYKVEVKTINVDLNNGLEAYESVRKQIEEKMIIILINNVSQITQMSERFLDLSPKQLLSILNKEMASVLIITSMVLQEMQKRKSGYIINISSVLAAKPIPYLSVQSAAKGFVDQFSTALSYECKPNEIVVQSLMPSIFSNHPITGLIGPTHRTYAKSAFNTIGRTNRTTGYLWHEFQYWLLEGVPQHFLPYLSIYFLRSIQY